MTSGEATQASVKRKRSRRSARPTKSTRKAKTLSYLEALPPEILQPIFFYSENVELTQTSTTILRKLSYSGAYEEICKRLLFSWESSLEGTQTTSCAKSRWSYYDHQKAKSLEDPVVLNAVTRLMNSRFFTWTYFYRLMHQQLDESFWGRRSKSNWQAQFQQVLQRTVYDRVDEGLKIHRHLPQIWNLLWIDDVDNKWNVFDALWHIPMPRMHAEVPDKLLKAPFTPEKALLLHVLLHKFRFKLGQPTRTNLAIQAAILGNAHQLVWILTLGMQETLDFNQLLQVAVVEAGCDPLMVYMILALHYHLIAGNHGPVTDQPLLRPAIWNWAERESMNKNWKGEWLELSLERASFVRRGPISPDVYLATDPKQRRGLFVPQALQ